MPGCKKSKLQYLKTPTSNPYIPNDQTLSPNCNPLLSCNMWHDERRFSASISRMHCMVSVFSFPDVTQTAGLLLLGTPRHATVGRTDPMPRVSQESQRRGALSLEEGVGCQALRHSLDRTNQTHPVDFWDTILPQLPERKHELEKARKRSGALKLEPTCFSVSGRGSVWQSQYQNESVAEPIAILLESSFPIGIHCHLLRFGTTGPSKPT